jgi:hypothetical protein
MDELRSRENKIIDIKIKKENIKYLELWNVEVSVPNLELIGITRESVLNFQTRFFYELGHLLLTNKVFIRRSEDRYTYIFRITDFYAFNNLDKIKTLGDFILNNFPYKRLFLNEAPESMAFSIIKDESTNKRKIIRHNSFSEGNDIKKLRIE